MKNSNIALICLFSSFACSPIQRHLASTAPATPKNANDLLHLSQVVLGKVSNPSFDSKECLEYLGSLEDHLDNLNLKLISREALKLQGEEIAQNSWTIRTTLHSRLKEFDKSCVYQIQSSFRQFRFIEDYVMEIKNNVKPIKVAHRDFQKEKTPMLDGSPDYYFTRITEEGQKLQFEAGDMFVTRGLSFLSSMIARLGSRATQFSHIVFVYKDETTGKLQTIESYVGEGVAFHEFEWALKNDNARILWLRSKDKKLAKKASEKIAALVKSRAAAHNPIKYDYELNFNDAQTMSCAEVSQVAFEMASGGQFKIPFYPNEIKGADSLVSRLKIAKGSTYEPGDMEIDPRFEIMGEFSDLRLTRESRQKDAVMTEVYRWMNDYNYVLVDNMKSKMAGGIIWRARKTFAWPLVRKLLKIEDFKKDIPPNMLSTVALINQIGEVLAAELKARDLAYEKEHDVPMSALEMSRVLQDFRAEDLALYENKKTRKQSKFHNVFRAK